LWAPGNWLDALDVRWRFSSVILGVSRIGCMCGVPWHLPLVRATQPSALKEQPQSQQQRPKRVLTHSRSKRNRPARIHHCKQRLGGSTGPLLCHRPGRRHQSFSLLFLSSSLLPLFNQRTPLPQVFASQDSQGLRRFSPWCCTSDSSISIPSPAWTLAFIPG
jgi:hypothetical protein